MARFLFTVWPFAGHFFPDVAIARALRDRGHECAFYTGTKACQVLTDEGFLCFPFRHVNEERVYGILSSPQRGSLRWNKLLQFKTTLRKWLVETIPDQVRDLQIVLEDWRPDVVACDPTMLSPMLIFRELCNLRVAVTSFIPACMVPGPDAPPFGLGLPQPRSWHTRLVARLIAWGANMFTTDFRRAVDATRERYGLPVLSVSVYEFMGQMPLYLVPSTPEFDYQRHDLPVSVHYVGSCIWNRPRHMPTADWLARVPRDQPWVHITQGTMHNADPFVLRAGAEGLGHLPVQVIMTVGGDGEPIELGLGSRSIAPNVHIGGWVSHSELLPWTDVLVTTGGAGTVLAALDAAVPMVVIPTEWDKLENAQRVVEAGAGLRLAPQDCTPKGLREAVERVLRDPSFRQNAQRIAASFSRYGGSMRAAELLEGLAAGQPVGRGATG